MIDTSMWKEFRVGKLFSCETTLGIPSKNDLEDGNINYITRSAADNGFSGTCGNEDHRNESNCITIGAEGFVAFWQSDDFVAGNKVYALRHPEMNETNGLFVCASLNALSDRYSFADARVLDKIKVEVIKLPATSDGQPDWAYMESYMKQIMEETEKSLENLKKADDTKHPIDVSGWGAFRVGDYFHGIRGTSCKMQELNKGQTPIIAAARYNQGIAGFYDVPSEYENAITISCNGVGCGSTYYHDYPFAITGDAIVLENIGNVPTLALHFIASVYDAYFTRKYSYTDKCSANKAEAEMVALPATSDGQPDWQYMEDYMKSIMDQSEKVIKCLNTYTKGKE